MLKSKLYEFDLNNKRVFLRADLNAPITHILSEHKRVEVQDFKLKSTLPTIDLIQKKGGKIILATHLGRPKKNEDELSTKNLINWFIQNGYKMDFEPDLEKAYEKSFKDFDTILLLENLRFYMNEQEHSDTSTHIHYACSNLKAPTCLSAEALCEGWTKLSDFYVNDAFGTLHRKDTSIFLLPALFDDNHKTIGLLVEKELQNLENLKNPNHPFMLILGGAKVKDKLKTLETLLEKLDTIVLCPAMVFTLLKAENKEIGKSLVDNESIDFSLKLKEEINKKNIKLILPDDYLVTENIETKNFHLINANNFQKKDVGISFGPKTVKNLEPIINNSKIIFFNGLPGFTQNLETLKYIKELFEIMANSKAYVLIGGGDSTAAAIELGFENKFNLSTGGGVILYYLSGKELPGLKFL